MSGSVLSLRPEGLYCEAGDFYVDPWRPVNRAVITHAHSDHSRFGSNAYLCTTESVPLLKSRLGSDIRCEGLGYGHSIKLGNASLSFHPAGHIFGSAMVRVEVNGEVWVVSGDYKAEADPTCAPWEPVTCHGFVTETTFGLPIYRWTAQSEIMDQIVAWYEANRASGRASILCCYALGKAQRLMQGLHERGISLVVHGAIATMNRACAEGGLQVPPWQTVSEVSDLAGKPDWTTPVILCPPSATQSPWMKRFGDSSVAFASGWMAIRGIRRRRNYDQGFVLSDHVDWPSLLEAIKLSGAEKVWTTHGYAHQVARYLTDQGLDSRPLDTEFSSEEAEVDA